MLLRVAVWEAQRGLLMDIDMAACGQRLACRDREAVPAPTTVRTECGPASQIGKEESREGSIGLT